MIEWEPRGVTDNIFVLIAQSRGDPRHVHRATAFGRRRGECQCGGDQYECVMEDGQRIAICAQMVHWLN